MIGCSTTLLQATSCTGPLAGGVEVVSNADGNDDHAAVMLGAFPEAEMRAFHIGVDMSFFENRAPAAVLAHELGIPAGEWAVFVLLASGNSPIDDVVDCIQARFPRAAVMGGITGSSLLVSRYGHAKVYSTGVAGICMRGSVPKYRIHPDLRISLSSTNCHLHGRERSPLRQRLPGCCPALRSIHRSTGVGHPGPSGCLILQRWWSRFPQPYRTVTRCRNAQPHGMQVASKQRCSRS
jgi:hypothetical protein